jgi:hypothetical protein
MTWKEAGVPWRVLAVVGLIILAVNLYFIIPGLLEGRPLVGTSSSNPIYSNDGFHCPGDGPQHVHFHTCDGPSYTLPSGTKPSDYPYHD